MPRLIAWSATCVGVESAPLFYNAFAIFIDALCITYVALRMSTWLPAWLVLASFGAVPTTCEIFGNATNVQWFLQFFIAIACFVPSAEKSTTPALARVGGYVCLALAALSGPFSVLITGLAATAILVARVSPACTREAFGPSLLNIAISVGDAAKRFPVSNVALVAACAVVQGFVLKTNKIHVLPTQFNLAQSEMNNLNITGLSSFYQYQVALPMSPLFILEMIGIATAGGFLLARAASKPSVWAGISCLLFGLGLSQPILAYLKASELQALATTVRYCYLLTVVSCWIAWAVLLDAEPYWRNGSIALVALVLTASVSLRPDYFRRSPLHDLSWARHATEIRDGKLAVVPVNPVPWYFKVPAK